MVGFELDPCKVHGEGGELVAAGHVRADEDGRLTIEAPRYSGGSLWPGDAVVVVVASPLRGEVTLDAKVAASAPRRIEVVDLRMREVEQRRGAVRVPVTDPVRFTHVIVDGEPQPLDPPLDTLALDVSAYGMRFRADEAVPLGTLLVGELPTSARPVPVVAEVLRHEPLRGATAHGCRFVDMAEVDVEALFRWVTERQRQILAEKRNAV